MWYKFLNKKNKNNLLNNGKINKEEDIIICKQFINENNKLNRVFTSFKNNIDLFDYQKKLNFSDNCLYEVCINENLRKLYFDIDIDDKNFDHLKFIKNIINNIELELDKPIILCFSSHTKIKWSYHIVIPNYKTTKEGTKYFYEKIKNSLNYEKDLNYIDGEVYKNIQQFRILGSHKCLKNNIKILEKDLSKNLIIPKRLINKESIDKYIFSISLISYMNDGMDKNNLFLPKENEPKRVNKIYINEIDINKILDIFYLYYDQYIFEYKDYTEKDGNLILTFYRKEPSYCKICKRYHENENPYLCVYGIERDIFFYCRRSNKKGIKIGSLGLKKENILTMEDLEVKKLSPSSDNEEEIKKIYSNVKKEKNINFNDIDIKIF